MYNLCTTAYVVKFTVSAKLTLFLFGGGGYNCMSNRNAKEYATGEL